MRRLGYLVSIFLLFSIPISAQAMQQSEDLKKIYLYTMLIFMDNIESEYRLDARAPQSWQLLDKLHQERIGYSAQKGDYLGQEAQFTAEIVKHFSPEQVKILKKKGLLDVNTMAGQVLAYELIYKEHPLGGYHFLAKEPNLRQRLHLAFGSKEMGNFLLDQEAIWGEYLGLWMLIVRQRYGEFQALMSAHVRDYNAELIRLSERT
ncbi:hypothetical protein [Entomospira culicis]|uniref:Uncharacterized protein n=1 Tax=Entomospira culicis TaxID=2719989 RepID=A0A968L095_9SPIO|nr:hypothetical protein [Entomospira culicis]NIZ19927.1 hypothetical protein [Entomospira culicis]NIZ70116.1 hypothetical protein [Entomospira culicis]WDI38043.1 hypothetical protein PVA46_07845 [Entomospira culicis]WDI39666.1 hypothetical protein PVA47_07845 [Entomospira culicis]